MDITKDLIFNKLTRHEQMEVKSLLNLTIARVQSAYGADIHQFIHDYYLLDDFILEQNTQFKDEDEDGDL